MKKSTLLLLGVAGLVGIGVAALFLASRRAPEAAPAYEFDWSPGADRGVDMPRRVRLAGTDRYIDIRLLWDVTSEGAVDEEAFARMLAPRMVEFSTTTRTEACGQMCRFEDGRYSARITTNDAVVACAAAPICPPGAAPARRTIHSHCPPSRNLRATLADEILTDGRHPRGSVIPPCLTDRFSNDDLASGMPGYLAGRRGIYFQSDGRIRSIPRRDD